MPRRFVVPEPQREDRRQAALLRAKVDVGIVLRDMMGNGDAAEYFDREGVPHAVAQRILQQHGAPTGDDPKEDIVCEAAPLSAR